MVGVTLAGAPRAQDLGIRQYKPKSTLVVSEHPVPRAKYPVIDIHSHHSRLTQERWAEIVREMDAQHLQVLVNLSGGSGARLADSLNLIAGSPAPDRMVFFANLDFSDLDQPGYGARAAAKLETDLKAGARGLKIFKNLGMSVKRANGVRVPVDDPEFDPVWQTCALYGVPVLIHTAEPAPFFEPVTETNERWLELQVHPERRRPAGEFPPFETLVAERNHLFANHPTTTFIAAHFAYHANDLARLGRLLDNHPNVVTETGAILAELGRQPRAARAFFIKYQDRILFGKDSYVPSEYPYFWRTLETADEYFDYYRDYHAFWKLYGLDLPGVVLRKLYYGNALRLVPGLRASDFPPVGGATASH
ncbi:MAG: amidohydrolase family protein [Vicinamibacteria bacterium]|nr:amidohydrolase family protein [Vicinamibacteria bacterium]